MSTQLPPDAHLLLSFINRGLPWSKVVSEFVDNGFDDAAGNSSEVLIELQNGSVSITDHGNGIEDLNRLGTLGASASYHHEGNIGQYGVGAKAWLCKAKKLDVETVHAGRKHQHTFNLVPILRALKDKRTPTWLNAYSGKGRPTDTPSYTRLTLRDFKSDSGVIVTPALVNELQKSYWPGLLDGRRITIKDNRRRPFSETSVTALAPPSWSDKMTFESSVNGRRYKATIGILSENVGAYSGLFVGFLFRNICVEKSLPNRSVPPRVHGQIELSGDWRHALSNYKDAVIEDRESLLLDIETHAKRILDLADEYTEDIRLDKIALEIESVSAAAIRSAEGHLRLVPPRQRPSMTPKDPETVPADDSEDARKRSVLKDASKTRDDVAPVTGIKLEWGHLGNDTLGMVRMKGLQVTVTLNRDCPKLDALSRQPKYPGIYLAIGNELAMQCLELKVSEIEKAFGAMLGEATGSENYPSMMRAIRAWWGFIAEEQPAQVAA